MFEFHPVFESLSILTIMGDTSLIHQELAELRYGRGRQEKMEQNRLTRSRPIDNKVNAHLIVLHNDNRKLKYLLIVFVVAIFIAKYVLHISLILLSLSRCFSATSAGRARLVAIWSLYAAPRRVTQVARRAAHVNRDADIPFPLNEVSRPPLAWSLALYASTRLSFSTATRLGHIQGTLRGCVLVNGHGGAETAHC